jgi:hypothetical protein
MTTDTQPTGDRQLSPAAPAGAATCSAKTEQERGFPIDVRRMMGLDIAVKLSGIQAVADEMGLSPRAVRYKVEGTRGASDDDVLERQAAKLLTHAHKLRAIVTDPVSQTLATPLPVQIATVLAHCDHVERFAYERMGQGPDASPHLLSAAARRLAASIMSESTKTGAQG